ncbi:hypothetical protein [Blastococcus sp. LR1]|uniref:hypothetical protein n=1 Tax=Blastococcus sp. LR1 TaxID=2877000 RepID=UPI001CCE3F9D|nr:hypothetical protein [Blastococcus sp. LR1]MCA0144321.1 hypothetical protein [Blastococcus sp. LR1]
MNSGRSVLLGLLTALVCLSACSADPSPERETRAALPDYAPPAGAPSLCAGLAGSTHFLDIPAAMGELTAGIGGVDGRSRLAAARGELRGLVAELPADEHPELRAAGDRVVAALLELLGPTLTDDTRTAVLSSMDDFVAELQPACGFPA